MSRSPRRLARTLTEAGTTGALGFLAAVAIGAMATAGLDLLVPEVLAAGSASEALRYSVWLGVASLMVPLDAAGIAGDAAPLTGAAVAFWTMASSVRRCSPGWSAASVGTIGSTVAFAGLCWGAAAASHTGDAGVHPGSSLVLGLMWGGGAAAMGRSAARGDAAPEPPAVRVAAARSLLAPAVVAGGLAAGWLLAVGVASAVRGETTFAGLLGAGLLSVAFAPNVLGAVVALGTGARVELVFAYGDGATVAPEALALWDWGGGIAPWYVLALVLVPLLATTAAAMLTPDEAPLRRGLRTGVVLGALLYVLSVTGSLAATIPGTGAGVTLGVQGLPTLGLGVAWGVAGSFLARLLPRPSGAPRLTSR